MKTSLLTKWVAAVAGGCLIATSASALNITIGSAQRTGSLSSATQGATGSGTGNLDASTVNAAFGDSWTEVGHLDPGTGLNDGFLTITLTSGAWGANNVAGTWAIAPSFWTTYGDAVIGWHVGNGSGDPDFFMFLIEHGQTSGTWSYDRLSGGGGGFSNMQLFGSGKPTTRVPDGGLTVLMLGSALTGLGAIARRIKK
ncbi:MAG TPA: hypothetical protein VFW05_10240 [Verrucomicrobiae bacterium]|jgi:hypothetical protein|nr:hypothetical protein [Verrucomicrobiae bacterium]